MITVETRSRIVPVRYDLGDIVYHRLAEERRKGMVTGISITPDEIQYWVTWPPEYLEKQHYECELSTEFVPDYESIE